MSDSNIACRLVLEPTGKETKRSIFGLVGNIFRNEGIYTREEIEERTHEYWKIAKYRLKDFVTRGLIIDDKRKLVCEELFSEGGERNYRVYMRKNN